MQVHSIWLEPNREIRQAIENTRRQLSSHGRPNLAMALPPWYLFIFDDFTPPVPAEKPFWLPLQQRLSDRIIRRDRSSLHYSSPKLSILPHLHNFRWVLPGTFRGMRVEIAGGRLPDLRHYAGEYRGNIPLIGENAQLFVPLFWTKDTQTCPPLTVHRLPRRTERCSCHLVTIIMGDDRLPALEWESLAQFDLTRYKPSAS